MDEGNLRALPDAGPDGGRLTENIMHFARVLRRAGFPIGPGQVLEALRSVSAVGLDNREDFYWTLYAVFVTRRDQREIFDQAFHIFWRNPDILGRMMSMMLPEMGAMQDAPQGEELSRRLAEALSAGNSQAKEREDEEITLDAT